MNDKLAYSFDDEVVSAFLYDMKNNRIEVHFESYHDLVKNQSVQMPCALVIENWKDAIGKLNKDSKYTRRYFLANIASRRQRRNVNLG